MSALQIIKNSFVDFEMDFNLDDRLYSEGFFGVWW